MERRQGKERSGGEREESGESIFVLFCFLMGTMPRRFKRREAEREREREREREMEKHRGRKRSEGR